MSAPRDKSATPHSGPRPTATVWSGNPPVTKSINNSSNPVLLEHGGVSHLAIGGGELHDFSKARESATDSVHFKAPDGIHTPLTPRSAGAVQARTAAYLAWKEKNEGLSGYANR